MILRISFADINKELIPLSNLTAQIEIDGELIEMTSSGDDLTNLTVEPTTISYIISNQDSALADAIVQTSNESDVLKLRLPIENPTDEVNVRIRVRETSSTEWQFENVFTVFNYDLGNNPSQGISQNPEFVIYVYDNEAVYAEFDPDTMNLEDFLNTLENAYQAVLIPGMITYRRPFTEDVLYYNATASQGSRLYESIDIANNNALRLGTMDGQVCSLFDTYIRQTITINVYEPTTTECTNCTSCCGDPCTETNTVTLSITDFTIHRATGNTLFNTVEFDQKNIRNTNLKQPTWIPESQLHVTNLTGDNGCAVLNRKDSYAILNIDEEITEFQINDTTSYLFDTFQVLYNLVAYTGQVIQSKSFVESVGVPFQYLIDESKRFEFDIPEVGDYIVHARIDFKANGEGMVYCEKSVPVDGKHWLGIEQDSCGEYKLINRSFEPLLVTIYKLGEEDFNEVVATVNIDTLTTATLNIDTDGLYKISSTRDEEEIFFILASYCTLRKCLESQVLDLLCKESDKIKDSTYYEFLSILVVAQTYFMKLHSIYMLNFAYTFLAPSQLQELLTMKELLDKATEYCEGCIPPDNISSLNCNCK